MREIREGRYPRTAKMVPVPGTTHAKAAGFLIGRLGRERAAPAGRKPTSPPVRPHAVAPASTASGGAGGASIVDGVGTGEPTQVCEK